MALWDIRGKALGLPLYKLLGGARRAIPAYAGGVSLGYQEPPTADRGSEEVRSTQGYKAIKLRVGDSVAARHRNECAPCAKRSATSWRSSRTPTSATSSRTSGSVMPAHGRARTSPGSRSPSPPTTTAATARRKGFGRTPLAAGENHYTRFEFDRVIEDGAITILQPDLSKTGGITEALRIAAMASAWKLPIHPHSSMTGLNHAASIHFLAAIDNGGYFEGDVSKSNRFRDDLVDNPGRIDKDGNVWPLEKPGLGLEVNEEFLAKHPPDRGPWIRMKTICSRSCWLFLWTVHCTDLPQQADPLGRALHRRRHHRHRHARGDAEDAGARSASRSSWTTARARTASSARTSWRRRRPTATRCSTVIAGVRRQRDAVPGQAALRSGRRASCRSRSPASRR